MNRINIKELRALRSDTIQAKLPCELVSDGEVIALLVAPDVALATPKVSQPVRQVVGELYHYSADWK